MGDEQLPPLRRSLYSRKLTKQLKIPRPTAQLPGYVGEMSKSVDPADLERTIGRYGFAYLVTVAERGVHVLAVSPVMSDSALVVDGVGRHSLANAVARPEVTLVWPPADPGDFSLIVDGSAVVDGSTITITPTGGILHRPAPTADGTGRAGSDCAPITS